MDLSDFSISMFNENPVYFNILVYEENDMPIYKDKEQKIYAARIKDINYKVVSVERIEKIDMEIYYKINYRNRLIGYFKPETSLFMFPKKRRQNKLDENIIFDNPLNKHLYLNRENFSELKTKIVFSDYYAVFEDEIYEGIIYKDELIGFFESKNIYALYKKVEDFTIEKETPVFTDSALTRDKQIFKPSKEVFKSEYIIKEEGKIRFKYNGKKYWVSDAEIDINYQVDDCEPITPSETLIKSILYQYNTKVMKSQKYYLDILRKELKKQQRE